MHDTVQKALATVLEDNAEQGTYRVAREIFTDPGIFELEMKHIFEGNWIYLAHESQIPNKNDYFTTYMGRQPIFIARDRNGQLNAFVNACSHRGAMLCRFKRGSRVIFTCPFHGWTFTNSGKLLKVKNPEGAGYPECFNKDGSHDLTKIARFESYRGFLFGSLNPDVVPLVEHLGEAAKMIDLIVDQSPEGLEVLRGASTYLYDGNWKLQTENGADGYHVTSVHWNYRRRSPTCPLCDWTRAGPRSTQVYLARQQRHRHRPDPRPRSRDARGYPGKPQHSRGLRYCATRAELSRAAVPPGSAAMPL
jgi:benzoate/toluate 1,2-dioxygenase alpha subunit